MTQAPIETRHKDMAAKAAEYEDWVSFEVSNHPVALAARASILAHAQTLANLEAARADLAEIAEIVVKNSWAYGGYADDIRAVAAIAAPYRANTPASPPATECPKCEAKDKAMAEIDHLANTSLSVVDKLGNGQDRCSAIRAIAARFIIPASDPVAEALKEAVKDCKYATLDCIEGEFAADLSKALTKRGLEIVERRDR